MILLFLIPALLVLAISYCTYRICFYSHPDKHPSPYDPMEGPQYEVQQENIHRAVGIMEKYPFEPVTITATDGTGLFARYYHFQDGAPVIIMVHGYRSAAFRDCCGGHALSRKLGFNALVVDQRAMGNSGGTTVTFGVRERFDCLQWANYVHDRFGPDVPILLFGLSMGAATVLMASELELPDSVACILADSPYSTPKAIIRKVCQDLHYPPDLVYPFIWLGALIFGRFRLDSCCAKEAVSHAKMPILLIHGQEDHLVPCPMSGEIQRACGSWAESHTFPKAGHGLSYMTDPVRYETVIYRFLREIPEVGSWIRKDFTLPS